MAVINETGWYKISTGHMTQTQKYKLTFTINTCTSSSLIHYLRFGSTRTAITDGRPHTPSEIFPDHVANECGKGWGVRYTWCTCEHKRI